jgi:hypothetical protein
MRNSPLDRLASRSREAVCFARGLPLPCWVYRGGLTPKGYSIIRLDSQRTAISHRVAYEQLIGPIPEGLELDHLCRNRACWNPWHLDPVTHAVNVRRGLAAAGLRARAALVTNCPAGHEYAGKNDRRRKDGKRYCHECAIERDRRKRKAAGAGIPNAMKTHCPAGHPFDDENTYVNPSGQRTCRICRRESLRSFRARKAKERI